MPRLTDKDFEDDGASFRLRRLSQLAALYPQAERVVVIDGRPTIEKPKIPKIIAIVLIPILLTLAVLFAELAYAIILIMGQYLGFIH